MQNRRQELGLSRRQLAGLLGVSRAYVGMIESGVRTPGLALSLRLASLLNIELRDLFPDLASRKEVDAHVRRDRT